MQNFDYKKENSHMEYRIENARSSPIFSWSGLTCTWKINNDLLTWIAQPTLTSKQN